jgi:DegV family protein with EDD domain
MNYQIITDSACDLPQQMLQELNVVTVPLIVNFRGEARNDSVEDAEVKELYDAMRGGEVATTSAVNPDGWSKVIEPALAAGKDALVLAFSSGLSTTYQSAVIAANELLESYPERKVIVIDTCAAAFGQGLLVWNTCKMRDAGLSLEALAAWVEENKNHVAHWFTVDDLVYLKRGGRVSAATAMLGTMLNIKPVLHVDDEGHLVSMVKARGRKAAINTLAAKLAEEGGDWDNSTVFICHADAMDDAQKLAQMVKEKSGVKETIIGNLGAVIGSHAGPGTLALFFMGNKK